MHRCACRYARVAGSAHSIRAVPVDLRSTAMCRRECRATQREVAVLIRRTREACGLTQRQLAQRMGSTQSDVARRETGDHETTMKTLSRVADALEVDLADALEVELMVRFGSQEATCRGT